MDTTITTLEFCAGYGGIGLGLKNIFGERMRTIAYCELEGYAQANLISKMEKGLMDAAPLWNDLKTFPYESFHGLVDILIAGYPCQPFSSAGKRAGKEDPRHLWPWIADGIRLLQPRMCFFENVEGHISLGLSTVISDLEELGYEVSWGIFSASEVGAVHQRKRVFIMAYRNEPRWEARWHNAISSQGRQPHELAPCGCDQGRAEELAHSSDEGFPRHWGLEQVGLSKRREVTKGCFAESGGLGSQGILWPSRPGQPQYAWEPPRVVGNTTSKRSCGGSEDGTNQQPEMLGEGHEAVGNSECIRIPTTREHGAMDEESGIPTYRERSEFTQADSESSSARKREGSWSNASKCSEIEPEMGRDIDGATYGVDISELSGLCHSELAEIRDWMVKGDNRTDELRSCGNGVVPATAERAFRVLMEELINK